MILTCLLVFLAAFAGMILQAAWLVYSANLPATGLGSVNGPGTNAAGIPSHNCVRSPSEPRGRRGTRSSRPTLFRLNPRLIFLP